MKVILVALLVTLAFTNQQKWDVVSSLPVSYTGLPFNLELGHGSGQYAWAAEVLPNFAVLDSRTGIITGRSDAVGAWPITIKVSNGVGQNLYRQYILNVVDAEKEQVWAGQGRNYYGRKVEGQNVFRIVTSQEPRAALVQVGTPFSYRFLTANAEGRPVYAFIGLPTGLSGDVYQGTVTGTFGVAGIYTIGVQSADQAGHTAEAFVTLTVVDGAAAGGKVTAAAVSQLSKVTVSNKVDFVYDIAALRAQQVEADKELFDALTVVNAVKIDLSSKQQVFDGVNVRLVAAEAGADKAAATAAQANTDRENAAARLKATNKALNDAEDRLNLALLEQAGAESNLKKAQDLLETAQIRFNDAQRALDAAEKRLQAAQTVLNTRKLEQAQAATALSNAQKAFNRANEDLNDAKQKVNNAEENLRRAEDELTQARNDLALAQQSYDIAVKQLNAARAQRDAAFAAHQASLKVLRSATAGHQEATTALGAAEWNLSQATNALNVANAAKEAADRTTALIIANGQARQAPKVNVVAVFNQCRVIHLPVFVGSVRIGRVFADRALLTTGNTILFGSCTQGVNLVVEGATVTIRGAVNAESNSIEVVEVKPSVLAA